MAQQPRQTRIGTYGGFTPTGVDRSAGDKMRALAGLGQQITESTLAIGKPIIEAKRAEEGAEAAEQARTVDPVTNEVTYGKVEKMSAAKFGAAQYNANLLRGYEASIATDVRQNLNRISVESQGNVDKFDESVKGYFKGMKGVSNIPVEVRAGIDTIVGTYRGQVVTEQTTNEVNLSNATQLQEAETAANDAIRFTSNGDLAAATVSRQEVVDYYDGQVLDNKISQVQANESIRIFDNQIFVASSRRAVDDIYNNQGYVAAISHVQNIENNRDPNMSETDHDSLVAQLTKDISSKDQLESARQSELSSGLTIRQDANASNLFIEILSGAATIDDVILAASNNDISTTQLGMLETQLSTAGQGVDDNATINTINELMLTNPEKAKQMIQQLAGGLSLSSKTALTLLTQIRDNDEQDGIMQRQEVKHFSKHLAELTKSVGYGGFVDPEEQARESELQTVYRSRVLAGEPPAEVARDLINANTAALSSSPYLGNSKSYEEAVGPNSLLMKAGLSDADLITQGNILAEYFKNKSAYDSFQLDYNRIMGIK